MTEQIKGERTLRILLVEDDEVDVMMFSRCLDRSGGKHKLNVARDGHEALEKLRRDKDRPQLLVLDLNMPRVSGLELLRHIRNDQSLQNLPVFVMTTSDREEDKIEAFRYNVAGYILKPVEPEDFMEVVRAMNLLWRNSEFPC